MSDRFVNPYNFIHLPKNKASAYKDADKHYGVIHYILTTKTPLFIPNSSNNDAFDLQVPGHTSYDFFSYTNLKNVKNVSGKYYEPIITGSEMRGVVRSVYETLTDSCMSTLNGKTRPVRRSGRFKPSLLQWTSDGSLSLVPANSYRIGDDKGFNLQGYANGDVIYIAKPKKIVEKVVLFSSKKTEECDTSGYLMKWGFGATKKYYHVFVEKDARTLKEDLAIDKLKCSVNALIDDYCNQPQVENLDAYREYKETFNKFIEEKGRKAIFFPINYAEISNELIYAPATFSKEISEYTISDLVERFLPCEEETCCPACDLFGRIGDYAKGSRIRFADLRVKEKKELNQYYLADYVTINALSAPKVSNVDFYLKRPDGSKFWTYDYYRKDGKLIRYKAELRGRKYYWHHPKLDIEIKRETPSNLNKSIRPLKKDITFEGELYFDGISEKQLKQLIYILNSGSEGLGLKLGMGKPLGFGSVSCEVTQVEERKIEVKNQNISYKVASYSYDGLTYEKAGLSEEVKAEFNKIAKLDALSPEIDVCYPKTEKQTSGEGFAWFVKNHSEGTRGREREEILNPLPHILDDDVSLPITIVPPRKNNYSSNGKPHSFKKSKSYSDNHFGNRSHNNGSKKNKHYKGH